MKISPRNFIVLLLVLTPLIVLIPTFFTTPQKVFASHSRVDLLTSDNFAVLAGSAITGTNTNIVNGDVGLDPTGGASITLLTCAEMATGTIYDNDGGYAGGGGGSTACRVTNAGLLTTAKNDLVTAYNDAVGRTTTATIATDLAAATLTDGTYDSASGTFEITGGGTLTLNGQGNADAVFIFKMATTLVTSSSSQVVLTNGAQACNVYWQVGSSATLGTSTTLRGNIMALTTIIDNGGSTVYGRFLARNGAVTLNNTTITKQACDPTPTPTPTPTATPTPTSSTSSSSTTSSTSSTGSGGTSSPFCPALASTIITPSIIESRRIDADSIFLSWGPDSGVDTFNVRYGLTDGNWSYNADVIGFSTTINGLPLNQPMWFQVAVRNSCQIGTYGASVLVGGISSSDSSSSSSFNSLSPGFPDTGFDPNKNNISRIILAGLFLTFFIFYLAL